MYDRKQKQQREKYNLLDTLLEGVDYKEYDITGRGIEEKQESV